jgi:hypothetical protein
MRSESFRLRRSARLFRRQSVSSGSMPRQRDKRHENGKWTRVLRQQNAAGPARSCTTVAGLIDTNVLVYRFDPRFPDKQAIAVEYLRRGIAEDSLRLPHQASSSSWPR